MSVAALQQWQGLIEQPLDFVGTHALAACLPDNLDSTPLSALRKQPRFQARLIRLLLSRHDLQALSDLPHPEVDDLPVLLLPPRAFKRLPRLCGAILHSTTLSREIRGDVVNQLRDLLGGDVFALALANSAQGNCADLLRQPSELLQAIDVDGARCMAAWLHAQPVPLRPWLRLRFAELHAEGEPVAPASVANALAIVRSAASNLQTLDEQGRQ
ncbi:type III secretion protein [Pseudomonas fluorescens]|uniref:Type III secretion protein n=1 Tax=Pseudomonas fluorescens TaxID=294 RepID=A0A944DUW0_PSEFL|nr:type III secretion protein [Pseudomonas fluorescens]MBT2297577.1 type III secretion protein [Pseudomonas fluorescens]MBT2305775.1 type III secretion protein [Pseudomonas fluorescens]MBT2314202.1 type III secretion protein [Pseudomonas fluorescens]MBT2319306.1 type III secretion protein [Pseudomonas fluorescens]MBT2327516.1 type III secretion protein [Pseudomonas fluorescens]